GSFLVATYLLALLPPGRALDPLVFLLLAAVYTLACRVEFEVGTGRAVPTELAFVPMLFLLPAWATPLCVATGLVAIGISDCIRGNATASRVLVTMGSSWHSVGPALVLGALAAGAPLQWRHWWIYVLAL